MNQETRICQNCRSQFTIEPEDFKFYEKIKVPPPTFCYLCRAQRRFAFRNERGLYKRKSDHSGEEIFSMYSPQSPVKIYENKVWYSDTWDPLDYGRDVDFSRPFLEQLGELFREVPRSALSTILLENSDYSNNATGLKNCYFLFNSNYSEDSAYGNGVDSSRDIFDSSHVNHSERVYEGFWLTKCAGIFFSSQCENCLEVYFSKNLRGCNNCFGCTNLVNKSYHIFNEPYSKEEYEKKLKEFNLGSYRNKTLLRERAKKFWLGFPNKFYEGIKNSNVSGEYIFHSKNVKDSYLVREGKDLRYCQYLQVPANENCYDHSMWGNNNYLTYECSVCGNGTNNIRFCAACWEDVKNLEYCTECRSSSDSFGCTSLRKKQYCVLNKQYSKEEYETLVSRIKKHMNEIPYKDKKGRVYKYGEFLPPELSPYGYNETIALEHFPLTKEAAIEAGYNWYDEPQKDYKISMESKELPDHIDEVTEDILQHIIGCEHKGNCEGRCTTAFRITSQEFNFYKKFGLPLPRLCPNCRHHRRIAQRSKLDLWHRKCQCTGATSENGAYKNTVTHHHGAGKCPNEFETTYPPNGKEIVYCEQCYNAEMV
ncbi:MAG: hypothetical protein V2A55_01405 [Candidatus Jorgensenbacteria bacterium]